MDDLGYLRNRWREFDPPAAPSFEKGFRSCHRLETITDAYVKVKKYYRFMIWVSVLIIIQSPIFYILQKDGINLGGWGMSIFYGCYGLAVLFMAIPVYNHIRRTTILSLPVKDALAYSLWLLKKFRRVKILNFLISIPLLVTLFYFIYKIGETEVLICAVAGGIIGFFISLPIKIRTSRALKRLYEEISKIYNEMNIE